MNENHDDAQPEKNEYQTQIVILRFRLLLE